jgi:2-oxoglutarate ferredoxin oxidoreductase subunit gamma
MLEEITIAGFGGQGVIMAGKLLCLAAMEGDKHVSHIPSYGVEMRGGTANCSVVISDEEIASPLVKTPGICVVLNKPSLLKFEERVRPGGLLLYNASLIDQAPSRTDINVRALKANDLAEEVGSSRVVNMIAIGALLKLAPQLATLEAAIKALDKAVSARNKKMNVVNIQALKLGYAGFETVKEAGL